MCGVLQPLQYMRDSFDPKLVFAVSIVLTLKALYPISILGDPGADSGAKGKSKRAEK